jgi:hypothetical protein
MLRSLAIGSYACNDTGRFVEGRDTWSFPDATPNAFGTSAQLSGAGRYESHYNDAPWQFVQVFSAADRAQLDAFMAALVPGADITLEEDTGSASSRIVSVDSTLVNTTGFTSVMVSGTRRPAWRGESQTFSLSAAFGGGAQVTLPTIGGTLGASMDIAVMHTTSGTFSALGIKHAPISGYDPVDSSGSWTANVALSATPATIHAGNDIDVAANRGKSVLVANLKHTATVASTLKWRAKSTILTAASQGRPTSSAVANTSELINLGEVTIPAAPLPDGSGGIVYGADTAGATNTTAASKVVLDLYGCGETFSHPGGEQSGVTFKAQNPDSIAHTLTVRLYNSSGGTPTGGQLTSTTVTLPAGHDGIVRATWATVQPAGTYAYRIHEQSGSSYIQSPVLIYQDNAAGYASGTGYACYPSGGSFAWAAGRYAATATTIAQNAYDTTGSDSVEVTQTFAATGRVQTASAWAYFISNDVTGRAWMELRTAGGTVLGTSADFSGTVAKRTITVDTADYAGQTLTLALCVEGEQGVMVGFQRNTTSVYAGGACSAGGDLRFEVTEKVAAPFDAYFIAHHRSVTNFNAKTPITATCSQSGKTAAFMSCTRIPADIGAVVVQTAFSAGEGWAYDSATRAYYPANSNGVTGTALSPYKIGALEPLPGENKLVLYGNGGAVTIIGTITEQRITRG